MDEQTQCNKCKRFYSKDEMHNCTMESIMLEYEFYIDLEDYKGIISITKEIREKDKKYLPEQLYEKYKMEAVNEFHANWRCKYKRR